MDEKQRMKALNSLYSLGFVPAYGKVKTMQRIMNKSVSGNGPQYYFAFKDEEPVGYMFLIGDEHLYRSFPWLCVHNADELGERLCEKLLEVEIEFWKNSGREDMVFHCKEWLKDYKQGKLGTRKR